MYKLIKNYFEFKDNRGVIKGLIDFGNWQEINYIQTNAGVTRGGHYHKKTEEIFIILEGTIEAEFKQDDKFEKVTLQKGDVMLIEPLVVHTFHIKTDAVWINALSIKNDSKNPDIYKE